MKKLLWVWILCIALSGCAHGNSVYTSDGVNSSDSQSIDESAGDTNDSTTMIADSTPDTTRQSSPPWKKEVAKKLLKEFNEYYNKMQKGDKLSYNRIMASDRATGLLCVYKDDISADDLKSIRSKMSVLNIDNTDCTFVAGYTESGLHIIALQDVQDEGSMFYEPLCNYVRQDDQEVPLFEDLYFNHHCFLDDLYIEDLRNQRETFDVKVDCKIINGDACANAEEIPSLEDKTAAALKKYHRTVEPKDGIYKNKTWRLIATKKISDFVRVYVDNETIDLGYLAREKQYYNYRTW